VVPKSDGNGKLPEEPAKTSEENGEEVVNPIPEPKVVAPVTPNPPVVEDTADMEVDEVEAKEKDLSAPVVVTPPTSVAPSVPTIPVSTPLSEEDTKKD